jgi:Putative Ig domain/FG-GAP repeat
MSAARTPTVQCGYTAADLPAAALWAASSRVGGSDRTQQGRKLTGAGVGDHAEFGRSVALSSDGNTVLIGGPGDNSLVGAAWVFVPCTALRVEASTLPVATRGRAYKTGLVACGGAPPYKWKNVGALPKGLKLTKTGVISGTPKPKLAAASYAVGVKVADSKKQSARATLALTIN